MKKLLCSILLFFILAQSAYSILPDKKYRRYPEQLGLIYKDLDVTTQDGLKIKTWFFPAQKPLSEQERKEAWANPVKKEYKTLDDKPRPTIIICNGDAGNMSWIQLSFARAFTAAGYNVVTFDWRNFGESSSWEMDIDYLVYTELLLDYDAVIEDVISLNEVGNNNLVLMGWSTGAYLSMAAASKWDQVKYFVGQALITSFDDVMPLLNSISKNKNRKIIVPKDYPVNLMPINLAPTFNKASLLIVGDKDDRTPVYMSQQIMEKLPAEKELWIIEGAEHGGPNGPMKDFNIYAKKIIAFLDKSIKH